MFLYAFTIDQDPRADTFNSSTDWSFALIHAEVSLQISSSPLKPSNLVGVISASFTVPAAGKSIQPALLARKIITVTQTALSWSTIAFFFFFSGQQLSCALIRLNSASEFSWQLCRLTPHVKAFKVFKMGPSVLE